MISTGEARAWLMRLPGRAQRSPATSLGPVVARFLSAPGPWPRDQLRQLLCDDLETAGVVEAVMHSRLKDANPLYNPDDYPELPQEGNIVVVEGKRVPIELLSPDESLRTEANDEWRQMRERLRKGGTNV